MVAGDHMTTNVLIHFNIILQLQQGKKIMLLNHKLVNNSGTKYNSYKKKINVINTFT